MGDWEAKSFFLSSLSLRCLLDVHVVTQSRQWPVGLELGGEISSIETRNFKESSEHR